ncbi:MAG: hypothetical protein IPK50_07860 [Fibrobacterota bacterium]|nr:MAG: hypothetical protein IPK50_07860 [Fibrobacterota bacterium]
MITLKYRQFPKPLLARLEKLDERSGGEGWLWYPRGGSMALWFMFFVIGIPAAMVGTGTVDGLFTPKEGDPAALPIAWLSMLPALVLGWKCLDQLLYSRIPGILVTRRYLLQIERRRVDVLKLHQAQWLQEDSVKDRFGIPVATAVRLLVEGKPVGFDLRSKEQVEALKTHIDTVVRAQDHESEIDDNTMQRHFLDEDRAW